MIEEVDFSGNILLVGAQGVDAIEVPVDEASCNAWSVAGQRWDVEVEGEGFGVETGGKASVGESNVEVHKCDLIKAAAELPGEAHGVDYTLEGGPVGVILMLVWVLKPYAKTIVDEPAEKVKSREKG